MIRVQTVETSDILELSVKINDFIKTMKIDKKDFMGFQYQHIEHPKLPFFTDVGILVYDDNSNIGDPNDDVL